MKLKDLTIEFEPLKKMAKALNEAVDGEGSSFLEKKIKTIAVNKEKLAEVFIMAIRGIDEAIAGDLPEEVIDYYNETFAEVELEGEEAADPEPEKETKPEPETKTTAKKKDPAVAPAEKKPATKKKAAGENLSCFGHKLGSQAGALDNLLNDNPKGITLEDLAKKSGRSALGVKGHIRHLITERGLTIEDKDGVYKLKK